MKRTLTVNPPELSLSATDTDKLAGVLEMFNSVVAVSRIVFNRVSLVNVEPKVFVYRIEAADGRIWRQHITFDNLSDPLMTFEVADQWKLSEFSNQRNVRNILVGLVGTYPTFERVVYDYLA